VHLNEKKMILTLQVKAGSIFDNILICDDPAYARSIVDDYFAQHREVDFQVFVYLFASFWIKSKKFFDLASV